MRKIQIYKPQMGAAQINLNQMPATVPMPPMNWPGAGQAQATGGFIPSAVPNGAPGIQTGGGHVPASGLLPVSYNGNERTLTAEVVMNSAQQQYTFPDLQTLLNKRIISIESFDSTECPKCPQSGLSNVAAALQKVLFLQLFDATNTALMDKHLLTDFDPQKNNGRIRSIDYTNVIWTNSKLICSDTSVWSTPVAAYIIIHYLERS